MSKIMVAYFSRPGENYVNGSIRTLAVGNTEVVARMAADVTGGELFRIEPVAAYPEDYTACTEKAQAELRAGARPALRELPSDASHIDTLVLCYPNWWGTMPMAVYTFLEALDLAGTTILPLCTHEGSGLASTERDIARTCPDATVLGGLAVHGADAARARPAVERWLAGALGI